MNAKTTNKIIDTLNNLNIVSSRLNLKKFTENEVEFNVQHEMDPELMRYIRDPLSYDETYKRTSKRAGDWSGDEDDWVLFAIRSRQTNEYIGLICFRYESIDNDTVEIGWRLGQQHHGKGYATEAAQCFLDFIKSSIKPHKVMAYCIADNRASSNIMTKLGMQKEGHLRQFCKLGGQWFDETIYGLIIN